MALVTQEHLEKIIVQGDNEELVRQAERAGKKLKDNNLTTSQIRNIFGAVRRIELDWQHPEENPDNERLRMAQREFALLQPRMAYQAGRERGDAVKDLKEVLLPAMKLVGTEYSRFRNFVDFFEAILAYHKAAGGREQ